MLPFLCAGLVLVRTLCKPTNHRNDVLGEWAHFNAVYRAGRNTQVAACAFIHDYAVHQLGSAENGINRASLNAFGAADAFSFADVGNLSCSRSALCVEGNDRHLEQLCEGMKGFFTTRRAFVNRFALRNPLCIRFAARVAAFSALGLRQ